MRKVRWLLLIAVIVGCTSFGLERQAAVPQARKTEYVAAKWKLWPSRESKPKTPPPPGSVPPPQRIDVPIAPDVQGPSMPPPGSPIEWGPQAKRRTPQVR